MLQGALSLLAFGKSFFKVFNLLVEANNFVFLFIEHGGIVHESCAIGIDAGEVDLFLEQSLYFMLQKEKSFFELLLLGPWQLGQLRVSIEGIIQRSQIIL